MSRGVVRKETAPVRLVLVGAAVAWLVVVGRMRGMDAGPGTDLGTFGWFIGIWVTMMAAMMLPSAAPAVAMFSGLRRGACAMSFVVGYLLAWAACGVVAYSVYRGARAVAPSWIAWDRRGPWVAGAGLVVAGLYQLAPLKSRCLRHCRSPLRFLLNRRPGLAGDVETGVLHGMYCVGCCAGLMLALFALGVMSLVWMAVVSAVVAVEKTLPRGEKLGRLVAAALVSLGVWVAVGHTHVPGLTQPPAQMEMQR